VSWVLLNVTLLQNLWRVTNVVLPVPLASTMEVMEFVVDQAQLAAFMAEIQRSQLAVILDILLVMPTLVASTNNK